MINLKNAPLRATCPTGPVGLVAAAGTGLQEVHVQLARRGVGVLHAIFDTSLVSARAKWYIKPARRPPSIYICLQKLGHCAVHNLGTGYGDRPG
ncbi:hypothetical protein, partial [Acetomicrobium sp. S15 = DSM 107314]|uniref:hypothetical protein n=1 Tax=Acetomicrobium sp. S15 = DSM 107314 TaxID=2529858 RepID=UPI0018E1C9EE